MSDPTDPSLLSYPRLSPSPSDDAPGDPHTPSLISFDSPLLAPKSTTITCSTAGGTFSPAGETFPSVGADSSTVGDTFSPSGGDFPTIGSAYSSAEIDFSTAGSAYSSAGGDFSTAGSTFSSAGGDFSTAGSTFSSAGGNFSTAGGTFSSAGGDFSTAGSAFSSSGGDFSSVGGTFTAGGSLNAGGDPSNTGGSLFDTGLPFSNASNSISGTQQLTPVPTPMADPVQQHSALHSMFNPQSRGVSGSSDPQTLRIHYLEQLCSKLQREKTELQEDFGKQRKKFMDKMLEMESERTLLANTIERYGKEIREISTQLLSKDEELKNVSMVAKVSESQTREDFDADRVKYEEEIASLRQIMNVQTQEQNLVLKQERDAWKREKDGMLAEIQRLRQPNTPRYTPSPSSSLPVRPPDPHTRLTPSHNSPESENLEFGMAKAALDVQVLKSVVVPLEEEIDMLKVKLKETEEQLAYYEAKQSAPPTETTPPLIDFDSNATSPTPGGGSNSDTDMMTQLKHQLKLERSARQDLEMHTEALVQQKTLTHQEILVLTQELEKYKDRYKRENKEHEALKTEFQSLKQTWELANQHFLEDQNSLQGEIQSLQQQLSVQREEVYSPASPAMEGEEFVVVNSLGTPLSHRRSQSSGKVTPPSNELKRRMSTSLPQLDQVSGDDTQAPAGASGLERRVATLQQEADRLREALARKTKTCASYESQLQRLQGQMVEEMEEKDRDVDRLRAEIEKLKAGIMRERETQKTLRRTVQENVEQIRSKMDGFRETEKKVKQEVRKRKDFFTELKTDTQAEITRLTVDRNALRRQMETAREEYDCLKVVQSQEIADHQLKISEETVSRLETEQKLQTTKKQLTVVQSRLQATEEDLCAQLELVKGQLLTDRQVKETVTSELMVQLSNVKKENEGLQSLKTDIEVERRAKEEALSSKASIQDKSTSFIQEQQKQIEKLHKEKEAKEKQIGELTRQVSSLKHQLDRTSETQKDFVELSQSLQMKLAEIEESQMSNSSDGTS